MSPPFACEHCDRTFTKRYSLNRHQHSIHHVTPLKVPRKAILCPIRNCNDTFTYHGPLRSHLKSTHNIQLQGQKLTFASMKDFFEWKEKEEIKLFVKYVKACGVQRLLDHTEVFRFNCHRTGIYTPEGKGLRKLKSQGSCKIGASCPSTITAHKHPDESVTCTYCLTHVGHEIVNSRDYSNSEAETPTTDPVESNPQVIKIIYPSAITNIIAANLPDSTNIVSIVPKLTSTLVQNHNVYNLFKLSDEDQVVLSIILGQDGSNVELLKGIRNITKKVFVENFNGLLSKWKTVEKSVPLQNMKVPAEMETFLGKLLGNDEENPVLFYQHIAQQVEEANARFGRINFIIMNSLQSLILQSYGNGGVICIDAVNGTFSENQDFVLIAIFVLNEYKGWNLCGLCMFLEMSEEILSVTFTQIRNRTGPIAPKILLGDHNNFIRKAWERAMGKCDIYFICSWHLDKTSQVLLAQDQTDKIKLACTYKVLLNLLGCENEQRFNELAILLETTSPACQQNDKFWTFFKSNYVEKKSKCAKCFRTDSLNNATNLLEPIHYLLEYVCNGHERKLSEALCILLIFFRKQTFEDIDVRELEQSACVDLSANEHQASLLLSKSLVSSVAECQWSVQDGCQKHFLEKEMDRCPYHCEAACTSCDMCLRSFNCSCINNVACWKICRHIHLVSKLNQGECWQEDTLDMNVEENSMIIAENATPQDDPEVQILVKKEDTVNVLTFMQECSRKIMANSKHLRGEKDLAKLKESMLNTLKLSETMMGEDESPKELGIQCNVEAEMDFFNTKSHSDHDYTLQC